MIFNGSSGVTNEMSCSQECVLNKMIFIAYKHPVSDINHQIELQVVFSFLRFTLIELKK